MRLEFVTALATIVSVGATARAQSHGASAADRDYRSGIEQFIARGRGAEGREYFLRLWERTHQPRMLWQVAVSESLMGRWQEAERHMVQVLGDARDPWVRAQRGGADGLDEDLRRAREHLALVEVVCAPTCTGVTVNDEPAVQGMIYIRSGAARVVAQREGAVPVTRTITATAGGRQTVRVAFENPRRTSALPLDEVADESVPIAPPEALPARGFPRLVVDAGVGFGLAYIDGRPQYAERFDYTVGSSSGYSCAPRLCFSTVDSGFATTALMHLSVRVNLSRRIGLALATRFQFDAADWTTSTTFMDGSRLIELSRNNPFANLLLTLRLYVALGREGYAASGWGSSLYAGLGGGQIEPKPSLNSGSYQPVAHIVSGYLNAQLGYRLEYAWQVGFHIAAEITAQFMFPVKLFDVDVAAMVGFHI